MRQHGKRRQERIREKRGFEDKGDLTREQWMLLPLGRFTRSVAFNSLQHHIPFGAPTHWVYKTWRSQARDSRCTWSKRV
jgi:hypothetical protein